MGAKTRKILALILAIAMCLSFATVTRAYVDTHPNTHRNTGHHIADLIGVARTQLGYTELSTSTGLPLSADQDGGYTKYGAAFGESTGAWCAYFIAWCGAQAGIPSSVLPRLGNCGTMADWYAARSRYYTPSSGYVPKTGDIIFYNWNGIMNSQQHVGIVTGVSGTNIYTIEGNTDSSRGYRCAGKVRTLGAYYIIGYGVPAYNDASTYVGSYSFASSLSGSSGSRSQSIAYRTSKLSVITTSATDITSVDAVLNGSIQNAEGLYMSSYGFLFGEKKDSLTKYSLGGGTRKSKVDLSMQVSKKIGKSLSPNTTYYYETYVTIDGRNYTGPMYAVVTVNDKPSEIVLSEKTVNVGVGQTTEVMAAQLPIGSTDKGITWISANTDIATVTDGIIMGVGFGKVVITAKTNYGDVSTQCIANVLIPAPQNIQLLNTAQNIITVKWDKVENAKGYIIYRTESMDEEFREYKKLSGSKDTFVDEDVEPGKRYYYRLQTLAKEEEYNSDITETYYTTARIPAPQNVTASDFVAATVRLKWDSVEEAKSYTIYRAEDFGGLYTIVGTSKTTEFIDTDVMSYNDYYYKVVADNGGNRTASDYSEIAAAIPCPAALGMVDFELPVPMNLGLLEDPESKISRHFGNTDIPGIYKFK